MEADLRIMKDLKGRIERGRSNFNKLNKDSMTESYVVARLEGLEDILKRFLNKHEIIIATYTSEEIEESGYIADDVFNSGYEIYLNYKSELNSSMHSKTKYSKSFDTSSAYTVTGSLVKLPKISIPMFSGNYSEWSSFKDLFVSLIHNNPTLDDVQRLHYLKTQLKGEAEQLIKHIPITQSNYTKCWELLQDRYNNKRFLLNCIFKRLFNQQVLANESSRGLKDLLDTTSDCMHELTNLGIKVESWDLILIYIVSLKLDAETRKQWELHVNNLSQQFPTFVNLKEFLEHRFRALEFVEHAKTKSTQNNDRYFKAFHTTLAVTCPYCTDNHNAISCNKFTQEHDNKRQDIVESVGLYCNRLGEHKEECCVPIPSHFCRSPDNCGPCPVAVAPIATETDQKVKLKQNSLFQTNEVNHLANNFAMSPTIHSQTLLATALIKSEARNGNSHLLKALLDQGSEASFISEAAVQLLGLTKVATKGCISGLSDKQSDLMSNYMVRVNLQSLHEPNFKVQVKAYVLNTVTEELPKQKFVLPYWADLGRISLADPQYNSPNKIDILLGAEVYCSILKKGLLKHPMGLIIAQDTHFGWVLSGQVGDSNDTNCKDHNINCDTLKTLKNKNQNSFRKRKKGLAKLPNEKIKENEFSRMLKLAWSYKAEKFDNTANTRFINEMDPITPCRSIENSLNLPRQDHVSENKVTWNFPRRGKHKLT